MKASWFVGMAIIDHFEVTVEVEGNKTHEHHDEELDALSSETRIPTVARYIEARSSQQFSLRIRLRAGYRFPAGSNSLAWSVYIDGNPVMRRIMKQEEYQERGSLRSHAYCKWSKCGDEWAKHPFIFWDLDITQDSIAGDPQSTKSRYGKLGTIEVGVLPYFTWGRNDMSSSREQPVTFNKSVSEKALKGRAVTLGAGLGDAVACEAPHTYSGFEIDTQPLAKFIFHYRTKRSLQDLMVIARDNIDATTAEQSSLSLKQDWASQRALKVKGESKPAIKRELEVYEVDDDILEVREVKRPRGIPIEIIEIDSD